MRTSPKQDSDEREGLIGGQERRVLGQGSKNVSAAVASVAELAGVDQSAGYSPLSHGVRGGRTETRRRVRDDSRYSSADDELLTDDRESVAESPLVRPAAPVASTRHSELDGAAEARVRGYETRHTSSRTTFGRRFVVRDTARKAHAATCTLFVVSLTLILAVALAAFTGAWNWRETFTYRETVFESVSACRAVSLGGEYPCSGPWAAPCFDRSRCLPPGKEGAKLSVYVHDEHCTMRRSSEIVAGYRRGAVHQMWVQAADAFRQAAGTRGLLAQTAEEACIVVYAVPLVDECVSRTTTWREGQNHLLIDFNDQSREVRPTLDAKAMWAQSNMRPCYFRYGYDISLPLRARKLFFELRGTSPDERKYFATFKGSLYLSGNGFAERTALRFLGQGPNDTDVVVAEHCETVNKEHLLSWNRDLCEQLEERYRETDYDDLMNTTFALLPGGRSPATYRLAEALSAGALPVFITKDYVKPFPGRIPWREFSFSFPPEHSTEALRTLRSVPPSELARMQTTALGVFDKFFGPGMASIVHTTLDILEQRLSFQADRR